MSARSEEFKEAAAKSTQIKEADNQLKLKLYALFKQSSSGKNTTKKPGMLDLVGKAKWEAWNSLGDMSNVCLILTTQLT
jgi:acyl-CoA-binding protein